MGLGRQSEAYAKIHFDSEKDKWKLILNIIYNYSRIDV